MNKKTTIDGPIYDARQLGTPKMLLLGLQHMFAMFGATVLVPALTGLDVATALLFAGIGTLLFHLLTGGKVPAFLGSSFAFIGGSTPPPPAGAAEVIAKSVAKAYTSNGATLSVLLYLRALRTAISPPHGASAQCCWFWCFSSTLQPVWQKQSSNRNSKPLRHR